MNVAVEADYLVVGAGATGLAFADALLDHSDARIAIVDRRGSPGGHWLDAYPFVRLHQASAFYGVASTPLGAGKLQTQGPEAGLHERATGTEICAYYDDIVRHKLLGTGRAQFFPECEYVGHGAFVSDLSKVRYEVGPKCRIVDARYLSPAIPADTPPPFDVADGARVVPVGALTSPRELAEHFVVVGSGKTATDACIWLMANGVDPDSIAWVRPRDPWMLNRAVVQPDPVIFTNFVADTLVAAAAARSLDDLFVRLEAQDIMLRIDRRVTPTMAKTPTLAQWEMERLRVVHNVVRKGHVRRVERGRLVLDGGSVRIPVDAVVVHCAADGLRRPPVIPLWGADAITLQPIRAGFPCFGAALAGYVEATRDDDDAKNEICAPTPYSDSLSQWAEMTVRGARSSARFLAEGDIREWADDVCLNPARTPPAWRASPELADARTRLKDVAPAGLTRLTDLASAGVG